MGTLIPLGDASRRPVGIPVVTVVIILTNAFVFALELMGGETCHQLVGDPRPNCFRPSLDHDHNGNVPARQLVAHDRQHDFGPEIEDAMGPWRYFAFYIVGGMVAMLAQVAANPHSTVPNLGASVAGP